MYSEKATKFCEISTLLLFYVVPVKSKVEILQNFVAFSEYMNFTSYTSRPLVNSIEIEVLEEMSFYAFTPLELDRLA